MNSIKQHYHVQQLFSIELAEVLRSRTNTPPLTFLTAGELQHCLDLSPDTTLLGLQPEHLRTVDPLHGVQVRIHTDNVFCGYVIVGYGLVH